MFIHITSFDEFRLAADQARAVGGDLVTVTATMAADHTTPIAVYAALQRQGGPTALLESVVQGKHIGRYSIIAGRPVLRFSVRGMRSEVEMIDSRVNTSALTQDPLDNLRALLRQHTPIRMPNQPRFCGGAIGYVGFESIRLLEPSLRESLCDPLDMPDILLYFYHEVVSFDHASQSLHLSVSISVGDASGDQRAYEVAQCRLADLQPLVTASVEPLLPLIGGGGKVVSNRSHDEYLSMVRRAKEHVTAGDVFQLVLSQRFQTTYPGSAIDFYRHLRRSNPSPYMFLLDLGGDLRIVGASPEVMVDCDGDVIRVRPIAGTHRRGSSDEEDSRLARELLADQKELAEHRMLIDLARNDLGRSCIPGTVEVVREEVVEFYSTVMHIVSDVVGRLEPSADLLTAFLNCLPAGTLSGAPKIRACELIAEIEQERRGVYGGAVGTFAADDIDTGILIRSAVLAGTSCIWQAGGGIVADSDPEAEYQETIAKGGAIGRLINPAFGGIVEKGERS